MSPGLGLGTCVQVAPSQCRIRVWFPAPPPVYPTAHTLVAETARTPVSTLSTVPGSGLGSTVQEEPFQCSVRVCLPPLLVRSSPTAQASHADSTATPKSSLLVADGLGGCVPVQFWQVSAAAAAGPSPASTEVISSGAASAAATCRSRARDGEWVIAGSFLVWVQPRLGGRAWTRARSAAVEGKGLLWAAGVEGANGPDVAGGGGRDSEQAVAGPRAGGGHGCPFAAVPVQDDGALPGAVFVGADGPGAAGGGGGNPIKDVAVRRAAGVRAGHLAPGGTIPVQDKGLLGRPGRDFANRPCVRRRGGAHPEQLARCPRVGARHLSPVAAVPVQSQGLNPGAGDDFSHRPGVTVRGGRDREQVVVVSDTSGVRTGHLLPGDTVPVQDQGLPAGTAVGVGTDGPGVVRRHHPHPVELVEAAARAGARDRLPGGAVPVLDQVLAAGAVAGRADGPDAGRRGGADAVEDVVAAAGIGAVHLRPGEPVPVLDQGLVHPPAEVDARRPHIAR